MSNSEFDQFYNEFIRDRWIYQIELLEANYKDATFWKNNLNLKEKSSLCKDVRSYLRNKFGEKKYDTETQRDFICHNILIPLKNRLARRSSDYADFKEYLEFRQIRINEVHNNCIQQLRALFRLGINRNLLLTEGDILAYDENKDIIVSLFQMDTQVDTYHQLYEDTQKTRLEEGERHSIHCH